jgi:ABC-type Fe3+-hydroxamate transport system substrate-binding protein
MTEFRETDAVSEKTTSAAPTTQFGTTTRRHMIVVSAAAALFASATATAASAQETSTREVEDMMGSVTFPLNPKRVIVDSSSTLGNMLAMRAKPIGTSVNPNSVPTYLADLTDGIADVTGEDGIDLEKALALNPDLVIAVWGSDGEGWNQENCQLYKQAVATYAYEHNYVYEEDLKLNVRDVALVLNMEAAGEQVVAEFDRRLADLRQKVVDAGFEDKPITVVRVFEDGNYSIRIGTSESIVFRAVGIPQPPDQQNPEDFAINLSLERLDVLNQAYAVVVYLDDNAELTKDDILNNEVWQALTPVRERRIVFVNSGIWNSIEILGALAIMDDIESLILPLAAEAS